MVIQLFTMLTHKILKTLFQSLKSIIRIIRSFIKLGKQLKMID
jgi:hypothetical protein